MKKLSVVLAALMIMVFSAVSAGAVDSPSPSDIGGESSATSSDANSSGSGSSGAGSSGAGSSSNSGTSTSPKTGLSSASLILAGLSALACGGVAVTAKKRITE